MLIPKSVLNTNINSAKILNSIRNTFPEGSLYRTTVPEAVYGDVENLRTIGNAILNDDGLRNSFVSTLINRIGKVILSSKLYNNPWTAFKMGTMELGETIEEIFVDIIEAHDFDPETAEKEIFKREKPNVYSVFHMLNFKKFYKTTVSEVELKQAFIAWNGVTDLVSKIIEKLYTSANYDEFLVMKYMLAYSAINGEMHTVTIPAVNQSTAKQIVAKIKGISNKLIFMSRDFNPMGVATYTAKEEQYLIVNSEFDATIDVEVLASAFNMDKANFSGQRILVDSFIFTDLELARLRKLLGNDPNYMDFTKEQLEILASITCMHLDKDFFRIVDNYVDTTSQFNGEGVYWNYWYHTWKTFSRSPFVNAVVYTTLAGSINSVTITPTEVSLNKGDKFKFTANVDATGIVNKDVTFSITEETESTIDSNGEITIAATESNTTLTVVATSVSDTTKSATATITIL